jgi:hypothetical protein
MMRSVMMCSSHKILGHEIKEGGMCGTCDTCRGFGVGEREGRDCLEDLDIDGRIAL